MYLNLSLLSSPVSLLPSSICWDFAKLNSSFLSLIIYTFTKYIFNFLNNIIHLDDIKLGLMFGIIGYSKYQTKIVIELARLWARLLCNTSKIYTRLWNIIINYSAHRLKKLNSNNSEIMTITTRLSNEP